MKGFWLDEAKVRIIVISFSILGLLILAILSAVSGTERVRVADLGSHIGDTVEVRGTVIGSDNQRGGLAEILIHEEGVLLEASIERSSRNLNPGDGVIMKGEPYERGGNIHISVPTDRSVKVERGQEPAEYSSITEGDICIVNGTVISAGKQGYSDVNLTIERPGMDGGRIRVWVLLMNHENVPGIGDGIEATGLHDPSGGVICYGSTAVRITFRAVPVTTSLTQLMGYDPGHVSRDPLIIEGYLRYTPVGRTLYIGESSEGARVSIKAFLEEPPMNVSRGDLVRLLNCSLEWDPSGMRYNLLPSGIQLIEAHGPWHISLSTIPYGIGEYEGCSVVIVAQLVRTVDSDLLVDGDRSLEIRGSDEGSIEHRGMVRFDPDTNAYYLEAGSSF